MATGAGDEYWNARNLPTIFKHALLRRYVPPFAGMTGSQTQTRRIVFLDGYAGRGRYDDGNPGSAEMIMRIAQEQARVGLSLRCYFVEEKAADAATLAGVVAEYAEAGVDATSHHGDVLDVVPEVVASAAGCPLFAFLDPCGLGLPLSELASMLRGDRQPLWPPTEFLLNFSLEAVRRIGGHLNSPNGNPATLARMDETVGGVWWRDHFASGVTDEAVRAVVSGYSRALHNATGMDVLSIPVRRAPLHKPIYDLVFGTRSGHGLWVFGDAVARATKTWWDSLEEVEAEADPNALFSVSATIRPDLATIESEAVPVIAGNLRQLLARHPRFRVVDHTAEVFGEYYGRVREPVVRAAVKRMHAAGETASTGVGPKPRDLVVEAPAASS